MKETEQLTLGVQRIERLVRCMEESVTPERIEIDLLLQELRSMYNIALELSEAKPDTVGEQTATIAVIEPEKCAEDIATEAIPEPVTENPEEPKAEPLAEPKEEPQEEPQPIIEELTPVATTAAIVEDEIDPEVEAQPLMQEVEDKGTETLFEETSDTADKQTEPTEPAEPIQPVKHAEEPKTAQPRQSSLFDYIRSSNHAPQEEGPATLGEKIGRSGNELRGETAQHKRVTDLRTVININDKFSFMKDLFQNNMKAYNDFIIQLNNIEDRATAQQRVDAVAQLYNWDRNSLTVKTFYSIFDRKF